MLKQLFLVAATLVATLALAEDYRVGNLHIEHAHARPTVPGQSSGAVYLSIENQGSIGDRLLKISSPIAKSAELHSMAMEGNIMRMREVASLELHPAARLAMQPGGGYHVMLIDLNRALKPGDKIPLSLRFEKAGQVEIAATVDNR